MSNVIHRISNWDTFTQRVAFVLDRWVGSSYLSSVPIGKLIATACLEVDFSESERIVAYLTSSLRSNCKTTGMHNPPVLLEQ